MKRDVLEELKSIVKQKHFTKVFVLVDSNTEKYCWPLFKAKIEPYHEFFLLSIPEGEEHKTIHTVTHLWDMLIANGADRNSLLINLGGGVVTDLGGFVASTFKRGISFIHVPTTLLAMVDAASGGKTGIDYQGVKNVIGTFAQASGVYVFPEFLKTLPKRQLRSGFAEVLKHGLIANAAYWNDAIEAWRINTFDGIIERSIQIKSGIVALDEKDHGLRKTLNFGHTIGHALESFYLSLGKPILHGEAVAAGMIMAAKISAEFNRITNIELDEIVNTISLIFPKLDFEQAQCAEILDWLKHDKKNREGTFQFVLLAGIGNAIIDVEVSYQKVNEVLNWYVQNPDL